jgi:hypothetical protein
VKIDVSSPQGRRTVYQTVGAGGSFGASSLQLETGLGLHGAIEEVEIKWPGGKHVQRFTRLPANRAYRIREGESKAVPVERHRFDLRSR